MCELLFGPKLLSDRTFTCHTHDFLWFYWLIVLPASIMRRTSRHRQDIFGTFFRCSPQDCCPSPGEYLIRVVSPSGHLFCVLVLFPKGERGVPSVLSEIRRISRCIRDNCTKKNLINQKVSPPSFSLLRRKHSSQACLESVSTDHRSAVAAFPETLLRSRTSCRVRIVHFRPVLTAGLREAPTAATSTIPAALPKTLWKPGWIGSRETHDSCRALRQLPA